MHPLDVSKRQVGRAKLAISFNGRPANIIKEIRNFTYVTSHYMIVY